MLELSHTRLQYPFDTEATAYLVWYPLFQSQEIEKETHLALVTILGQYVEELLDCWQQVCFHVLEHSDLLILPHLWEVYEPCSLPLVTISQPSRRLTQRLCTLKEFDFEFNYNWVKVNTQTHALSCRRTTGQIVHHNMEDFTAFLFEQQDSLSACDRENTFAPNEYAI